MNNNIKRTIYLPDDIWQRIRELSYKKELPKSTIIDSLLRTVLGMDTKREGEE